MSHKALAWHKPVLVQSLSVMLARSSLDTHPQMNLAITVDQLWISQRKINKLGAINSQYRYGERSRGGEAGNFALCFFQSAEYSQLNHEARVDVVFVSCIPFCPLMALLVYLVSCFKKRCAVQLTISTGLH